MRAREAGVRLDCAARCRCAPRARPRRAARRAASASRRRPRAGNPGACRCRSPLPHTEANRAFSGRSSGHGPARCVSCSADSECVRAPGPSRGDFKRRKGGSIMRIMAMKYNCSCIQSVAVCAVARARPHFDPNCPTCARVSIRARACATIPNTDSVLRPIWGSPQRVHKAIEHSVPILAQRQRCCRGGLAINRFSSGRSAALAWAVRPLAAIEPLPRLQEEAGNPSSSTRAPGFERSPNPRDAMQFEPRTSLPNLRSCGTDTGWVASGL